MFSTFSLVWLMPCSVCTVQLPLLHLVCIYLQYVSTVWRRWLAAEWHFYWWMCALSCDWLYTIPHIFSGLHLCVCVCVSALHLQSAPSAVKPLKQTDHIKCIDSAAIWQLLRTCRVWFPSLSPSSLTHSFVHIQAAGSFDIHFLENRSVGPLIPKVFSLSVCLCVFFFSSPSVWSLCSLFSSCPFSSTFICSPEGGGLTKGWGSMNCCVVAQPTQHLI